MEPTEAQLEAYHKQLMGNDPLAELRVEFGRMLLRHESTFSPDERIRFDELSKQLTQP